MNPTIPESTAALILTNLAFGEESLVQPVRGDVRRRQRRFQRRAWWRKRLA
jgi:hypothetical protein